MVRVVCPCCGQRLEVRLSRADEFRLTMLEKEPWHAGQIEEAARRMEAGEGVDGAVILERVLRQWEAAGIGIGVFVAPEGGVDGGHVLGR